MGLFGGKKNAIIDVIRCDENDYLIWKWAPKSDNAKKRENAIRSNSHLRVKDGEVAVFVYKQASSGQMQDFIEGPYDEKLKTGNFPVLSGIIGAAFGGDTPFQAEVYFVNLSGVIQVKFGVPYFDVFDPRYLDFAVPVAVRGTITFRIDDYRNFIKMHRLSQFDLNTFELQIRDAVIKYIKGVVTNIPSDYQIPVMQLERRLIEINEIVRSYLTPRMKEVHGVLLTDLDISVIDINKESTGYRQLRSVTSDAAEKTLHVEHELNIQNMKDMQRINTENIEESLKINREQAGYAQKMKTQGSNFAAHQLNQQTRVAMANADAFRAMGTSGGMNYNPNGSFNPGGMIAGMAIGGAMGQGMANMMGNTMAGISSQPQVPPQVPQVSYFIAVNGQSQGPYDISTLTSMISSGNITKDTLVWKNGMAQWSAAGTVSELSALFSTSGMPPLPPQL